MIWVIRMDSVPVGKNTGYNKGYSDGLSESNEPINLGAGTVKFTAQELQTFEKIKNL